MHGLYGKRKPAVGRSTGGKLQERDAVAVHVCCLSVPVQAALCQACKLLADGLSSRHLAS